MLPLDVSMMIQHGARNREMEFAWWFWSRWFHVGRGGREGERGWGKLGWCWVGGEGFCWFGGCCGDLRGFGVRYGSSFGEGSKSFESLFYRHTLRARSSGLFELFLGFVLRCFLSEWSILIFDSFRFGLTFCLFPCRLICRASLYLP